jgi:hypothetical protein
MTIQDKKCAPGHVYEYGSCIPLHIILDLVLAYNNEVKEDEDLLIQLLDDTSSVDQGKYKQYLVTELEFHLSDKCKNQKCWLKQKFINQLKESNQYELLYLVFRPDADSLDPHNWLNSNEIIKVMKQYEITYPKFFYLGTVPRDFYEHTPSGINTHNYQESLKNGKTNYGMVINLDKHHQSGSHWVALYFSFDNGQIFYFDSTKRKPDAEVVEYMNYIKNIMEERGVKPIDINYNKYQQHQYKNTECGIYAINFIIRMLRGDKFGDICRTPIPDDEINKCRKVYFGNIN